MGATSFRHLGLMGKADPSCNAYQQLSRRRVPDFKLGSPEFEDPCYLKSHQLDRLLGLQLLNLLQGKAGESRNLVVGNSFTEHVEGNPNVKPMEIHPEAPVFTSKNGQLLRHANFTRRAWNSYIPPSGKLTLGIVKQLAVEGKIDHYREPYACRDTFISHCLENGINPVQVAAWVGNSPEIIHRHYAGQTD